MSTSAAPVCELPSGPRMTLSEKLNGPWHERALQVFMLIVIAHWAEHLVQAFQIYVLGWPPPASRGVLGQFWPFLVKSEILHYGYAIVMLIGLWIFRKGFTGSDYVWWMVAFWIQFWHHIEHAILQAQPIIGANLMGSPVPLSLVQILIPQMRVELHLFYNTIVFIPMIIAMFKHMFPTPEEAVRQQCTCAWHKPATAVAG